MSEKTPLETVDEFQGLYGPFTVTERLLQKIWLTRNFNLNAARTTGGEPVEILFPGKWNRLAGPDFQDARLRIGGREVYGDVEIHFRAGDWFAHGHDSNPAFDRVVLHVVLFGSDEGERPVGDGSVPQLELLTLLHHDLEAYAADDAIEIGFEAKQWRALENLLLLDAPRRREKLAAQARRRWEQKKYFARLRIERVGWRQACHLSALEILGYRHNRPAMLDIGTRYPIQAWCDGSFSLDKVIADFDGRWKSSGTRPANDPRLRLRQYAEWIRARDGWPARLRQLASGEHLPEGDWDCASGPFRRRQRLGEFRDRWVEALLGPTSIGARRVATLFCDGLLPLAAVCDEAKDRAFFDLWFHWYPGDVPDSVSRALRTAGIVDGRMYPCSNGWCQGLLGLTFEQPDPVSL